ncbi:MAG: sugar phosphate nucleotidyltransferase [Eubacteriales bacterium]|nr:sugar phosphate nucleotidyltransferase [Eubacteriales bacterium]
MQDITLVVMAAGIGSRFGGGIKQLTPVGPNGELIIDYSIYDALEAGFNKVVFIIRKDIEKEFREIIGNRMEKKCKVAYVFQELEDIPKEFQVPQGRVKPWGTGQAILACKGVVNEPFAIINADDYYGKQAFVNLYDFLKEHANDTYHYCAAGFILKNTLSDNGGVTRGICNVNADGYLEGVDETPGVVKTKNGVKLLDSDRVIDENAHVSMNMWGVTPEYIDLLENGFSKFLEQIDDNPLKAEYLLPIIMDQLIQEKKVSVKVLETPDRWFGVTYAEDKDTVIQAFQSLVEKGVYTSPL